MGRQAGRSARGETAPQLDSELILVTGVCMLLPVLVTLDATVVNVAQRTFVEEFSSTQAVVAWTMTAYTLALAAVIPLTGWAANRMGTKRLVLGSVLLFTLGSVLCALATNIGALVTFRTLQGLGGGMLMPLQLIILARAAGPQRLGRVLTISIIPVLLAPICGPVLGGWLIGSFGWQWIFLINIPIGAVTLVLAALILPQDVPAPASSFDGVGAALLSPGLVLLLYGLSQIPARATGTEVWAPAAIGLTLIAGFVSHALRRRDRALIDLRLLEHRSVAAANATRFLFAVAFFGCCLLFPGYFQQALGKTPFQSGMLLLPQTLGAAAVIPVVGRVMERRGARGVAVLGAMLLAAGLTLFILGINRQPGTGPALLAGLALFGIGSGCLMIPVAWSAVQTLDSSEIAHGSTLFNVNHHTAAAIGAALMSILLTSMFKVADVSHAYATVFTVAAVLAAGIIVPASFLPTRPAPTGSPVRAGG